MDRPAYPDFDEEEIALRWKRAKELMSESGLDALLVTEEDNYSYLSGYRANGISLYSRTRPVVFILPRESEPVLIVNEYMKRDIQKRSWVKQIRTWLKLPFSIRPVKEAIEELGLSDGRIGAELGLEQRIAMPYNDFNNLREALSKAQFIDASNILWNLRMIKSKAEIERIERVCEIHSRAYEETFSEAGEGMSEKEVARLLSRLMIEEGADKSGFVVVTSGPNEADRISGGPTDRRLKRGDELWIDAGAVYKGYWSDFSREAVVGSPSIKQKKMHEFVCQLTQKCVSLVKPGLKTCDIMKECNRELQKVGLEPWRVGRIGHGLGRIITEPPSISLEDDTVLEPGMVITIEPGIVTDYGMFCIEENLLVTEEDHRVLTKASRDLHVL